ncbi:polysaccharide deacetylase [Paenibacillus radicis (ex Xue et al. 2023)]|uniref:Polysaccharide deacetylase n=1 Tax=Paenibacillus radicis (ex Xue et al. 2023) TaxID=2972489 RepID=A0ABT1YS02_9BACL|nr:polysaccharide deacetylase [Paenibacillus radicis (ex Xue et al. 2023)]MCR8635941.1 polysaccharide deacetylase [Paenibacillus radicis (ex Xue et al. 2023)]
MPNLPHVHLFRRISLFLSLMLVLLYFVEPVSRAYAAANDEERQEAYEQLKSGKRIWTDKAYVQPDQPTVYLTFDDGPSKLTGKVLDILREEGVLATFFMLGEQVKTYPEQVRQAVKDGHAIGNHTYNHKYNELYTSVASFWKQIEQTEQALDETAGVKTRLIRAPGGTFGNFDAFYFYYLDQAGFEVHDWNIDSGDSKRVGVPANEIIQTVKNGPFGDQVILLMHDGTGHEQTVKALPDIIRLFKAKGYAFAPLSPQVKPVHFSAGKIKWNRSVGSDLHNRLLAEAGEQRHAFEESGTEEDQELTQKEIESPQGQQLAGETRNLQEHRLEGTAFEGNGNVREQSLPSELLEVILGSDRLLFEPGQYRLTGGNYQVPVRNLIEAMGGHADWREGQRTAVVHYGSHVIEYDFSHHEMRVNQGEKQTVYHLPQMELRNGTVYVPLRKTVELLGSHIINDGVNNGNGRMQIQVALTGGYAVTFGF